MGSVINVLRSQECNLLNAMLEPESTKKKKVTLISSCLMMLLTALPTGLFFFRLHSTNLMN